MLKILSPLLPVPNPPMSGRLSPPLPWIPLRRLLRLVLGLQVAAVVGLIVVFSHASAWPFLGVLSLGVLVLSLGLGAMAVNRLLQSLQTLKATAQTVPQTPCSPPQNRALTTHEERWREFLDAIPLGIVVYDRGGQMVFASTEARQLLGLDHLGLDDLASRPPLGLADTFTAHSVDGGCPYPLEALPITQSLRGEKAWADDIVLQRGDQKIPIEMASTPIFDGAGQVEFAVAACQDLSTHRQAQQVLTDYSHTLEAMVAQRTHALEQAQITQRVILQAIPDLLIRYNRDGVCLDILSEGSVALLASPHTQIGRALTEVLPPAMAAERLRYIHLTLETGQPQQYEYRFETPKGWRHEEARLVVSGEDEVLVIVRDITERKQAEAALASQKQFLQNVIDSIPSIIVVKDRQNRIQIANRASAALHGMTPDTMLGQRDVEMNPNVSAAEADDSHRINQWVMETQEPYQSEQEIADVHGVSRWYQVLVNPFRDRAGNVNGVVGNCIDITDRKQMETELQAANEKLERLATLDGLTQIPNRRRFDEYLQQEWQRLVREQRPLSLILFDVDYFKPYNDHFGHQQGDEGLIAIAQAANQAVKRSVDLLARYGGEEFGVILPNTSRSGAENVAKAIQREVAALKLPHPKSEVNDYLTVSMGIASVVPNPEQALEELIAAADAALYQAKRRGRNRYWIRLI